MNQEISAWLLNYFQKENERAIQEKDLNDFLHSENAIIFFILWTIFEGHITSDGIKNPLLKTICKEYEPYYDNLQCENITSYFYDRYQDKTNLRHLVHNKGGESGQLFTEYLSLDYSTLNNEQKLLIILFTVFRYRNNIFHGSKGVESWSKYKNQIEKCIMFMQKMIDCQIQNKIGKI